MKKSCKFTQKVQLDICTFIIILVVAKCPYMDLKGEYINMFHEGLVPILLSVGVNLRGQELLLVAWNCVFKLDFIFHTHLNNKGVYCSSTSDRFWGILNVHILLVKYTEVCGPVFRETRSWSPCPSPAWSGQSPGCSAGTP